MLLALEAALDAPSPREGAGASDGPRAPVDPLELLAMEGAGPPRQEEAKEGAEARVAGGSSGPPAALSLHVDADRRLRRRRPRACVCTTWFCKRRPGRLYDRRRQRRSDCLALCGCPCDGSPCVVSWWTLELAGVWAFVVLGCAVTVAGCVLVVLESKADKTDQDIIPGGV